MFKIKKWEDRSPPSETIHFLSVLLLTRLHTDKQIQYSSKASNRFDKSAWSFGACVLCQLPPRKASPANPMLEKAKAPDQSFEALCSEAPMALLLDDIAGRNWKRSRNLNLIFSIEHTHHVEV